MTPALLQRRLAEFVDRTDEMERFCRMLDTGQRPVMVISGDSGYGKSSLLARMIHECSLRDRRKAEVVWTDTRPHDYLAVMRKVRDDLGARPFAAFTDLVNYYTKPDYHLMVEITGAPKIEVAAGARIQTSAQVGDIAGIVIKDLMINVPRSDMAVREEERMLRLTERFLTDLKADLGRKPATIFLDAAEKMSVDTAKWVWNELLGPVRDGILANVCVVICGQSHPELDRDWNDCVEVAKLGPLQPEHILDYLKKRSVPGDDAVLGSLANMLALSTKGKVSEVASLVDAYVKLPKRVAP